MGGAHAPGAPAPVPTPMCLLQSPHNRGSATGNICGQDLIPTEESAVN